MTTKLAIRLEPEEKDLLFYYARRLGLSPSALIRNQVKVLLKEMEEKLTDKYYLQLTSLDAYKGPTYSQEDIEKLFEIKQQ
jgi:predicted DNA-binding protein